MLVVLARADFRIVHLSVQANHVHMLVEADSSMALARGMQAFQISAARRLNAVDLDGAGRRRRGPVFPDRYHEEIIRTPTHARRALSYVLNNWRKHHEDRVPATRTWVIDPYSTARSFLGWLELAQCTERGDGGRARSAIRKQPMNEPGPGRCTSAVVVVGRGASRVGSPRRAKRGQPAPEMRV